MAGIQKRITGIPVEGGEMVRIVECSERGLKEKSLVKNMFCFGAGKLFQRFIKENPDVQVKKVIDNFKSGTEREIDVNGKVFPIISLEQFLKECSENTSIIITCKKYEDIISQLDLISELDGLECYLYLFLHECTEHYAKYPISKRKNNIIPKKIHYCWFGKNKVPDEYLKYMETWKKYCPDYEIIRWDEQNYDVMKNDYLRQAYNNEKWAFVSDYARVDVVYQYGGVYLDTDVELVKNFDEFLKWDMFCGFESTKYIAWGLGFGAVRGHEILQEVLKVYEQMDFIRSDGTLNLVKCPIIQSSVMSEYGFVLDGTPQEIGNVAVYPKEFFSPYSYAKCFGRITSNTHSIHHYSASWMEKEKKSKEKRYQLIDFIRQHQFSASEEQG